MSGPVCKVCRALDTLDPVEAEGLRDLLRGTLPFSVISDRLAADPDTPLLISPFMLAWHSRGRCSAREILRCPSDR